MSADVLAACESPIEERFLKRVLSTDVWQDLPLSSFRLGEDISSCRAALVRVDSPEVLLIQPAVTANGLQMRLDFLWLMPGICCAFAIELDGHDYHERTKEQARRDRSRDRALTTSGLKPLRFTGSEIHRDVSAAYDEVDNAALDEILHWFHRTSTMPADRERYTERRYSPEMLFGSDRRLEFFVNLGKRAKTA